MELNTELKKCPFCGSNGTIYHRDAKVLDDYIPECTNTDCIASYMLGKSFSNKEDAAFAWNNRK